MTGKYVDSGLRGELLDARAKLDLERTRTAELLAARWLSDGAQLWLDGVVSLEDCLGGDRRVSGKRVEAACTKLLQRFPSLARPPSRTWLLQVGIHDADRLIAWVAQGSTPAERRQRAAYAKQAIAAALAQIQPDAFNAAVRAAAHNLENQEAN